MFARRRRGGKIALPLILRSPCRGSVPGDSVLILDDPRVSCVRGRMKRHAADGPRRRRVKQSQSTTIYNDDRARQLSTLVTISRLTSSPDREQCTHAERDAGSSPRGSTMSPSPRSFSHECWKKKSTNSSLSVQQHGSRMT